MCLARHLSRLFKSAVGKDRRPACIIIFFLLIATLSALAESAPKPNKKDEKKAEEPKEVLVFKNGDQLTGKILNSEGADIKFESDMAGTITVPLAKIKELKSNREFAIVPKDVKDSRNSANVPQGYIKVGEDSIIVAKHPEDQAKALSPPADKKTEQQKEVPSAPSQEKAESSAPEKPKADATATIEKKQANGENADADQKTVEASRVGFVVDDPTYQQEIHKRIGLRSGWDGVITTGSTTIFATQDSYLFLIHVALKRSVPTVSWLDPKLRTLIDYTQSAGRTSQPGTVTSTTNIFHGSAERDEYFARRGYYLQQVSFDHDSTQGLDLQQIYGFGIGATLLKTTKSEFDVTADLHYESQQFNSTADVSSLSRHLVGSSLTEAYTRKLGKLNFDEKMLADIAWNDASAFSASATSAVRMPVYKKLALSVSIIDNFQNDPQVGYNKNSFQFSTGFALALH